jgi:hypothetical protein
MSVIGVTELLVTGTCNPIAMRRRALVMDCMEMLRRGSKIPSRLDKGPNANGSRGYSEYEND